MKKLALLLLFMSVVSQAAEEITGAFGFKLGEVFDMYRTDYVVSEPGYDEAGKIISIQENVAKPFDEYRLILTPKTHEIVGIKAMLYEDRRCTPHLEAYATAISDKYELDIIDEDEDLKHIINKNETKGIAIECSFESREDGSFYYNFIIMYVDISLGEKLQEESKDYTNADEIDASVL